MLVVVVSSFVLLQYGHPKILLNHDINWHSSIEYKIDNLPALIINLFLLLMQLQLFVVAGL